MRVTVGASFCVYPEPNPLIFLLVFRCGVLWPGRVDLPIVGTSLYLGVGFIKSGSSQTCQTSVPRLPPPLGADARQLLRVAYRGWVTSAQFIFILSIKSPFALLNLTLRMPYIPSQDFELGLGQDWTQDSTIFRFPAIFTSCKSHEGQGRVRVRVKLGLGLGLYRLR